MTPFTPAELGQLLALFVAPFACLVLVLVLGFRWGKPALESHGDPEHPEAPAKRVPWLFFGYLLALILVATGVRTLSALLLATLLFARPLPLEVVVAPGISLLLGLGLGIFCRMRAVRNATRP
jgi:ABC-type transport system involved in cytochrome c biogenesis permease subunit